MEWLQSMPERRGPERADRWSQGLQGHQGHQAPLASRGGSQKLSQSSSAVEAMATGLAAAVFAGAADAAGLAAAALGASAGARWIASLVVCVALAARAAVCGGAPLPPGSLKTETTRTS